MSYTPLHKWQPGDPLRADLFRQMTEAIPRILRGGRGIDVRKVGDQVAVSSTAPIKGSELIWVSVDSSGSAATGVNDTNGNPVQWKYTVTEQVKNAAGYGGWTDKDGGFTGTAYNLIEDANDGSGMQSHGINHDNINSGFNMSPIPDGTMLRAQLLRTAGSTLEAWVSYVNNVDGDCA